MIARNPMTRQLAFPSVGEYQIEGTVVVVHDGKSVAIDAEPIKVKVVEPSAADRALIEHLGSEADLERLFSFTSYQYCKDEPTALCFENLRSLVTVNPDSAYAPFVQYDLAMAVGLGLLKVTPKEELELELLRGFLSRWPQHGLRGSVMACLIDACIEAGDVEAARRYFRQFESEFAGRKNTVESLRRRIADHD